MTLLAPIRQAWRCTEHIEPGHFYRITIDKSCGFVCDRCGVKATEVRMYIDKPDPTVKNSDT